MLPALLPALAAPRLLSRQGLLTRSAGVRLACWLLCLCLQPPTQARDGSKDASAVDPPTQHQALPAALDVRARDYPEPDGYSLPSTPLGGSMQYLDLTGWLTPVQASRLGLTLGVVLQAQGAATRSTFEGALPPGTALAYDLGVRWQSELRPSLQLDLQAWARTHQYTGTQDAPGMIWNQHENSRLAPAWRCNGPLRAQAALSPSLAPSACNCRATHVCCCASGAAAPCCTTGQSSDGPRAERGSSYNHRRRASPHGEAANRVRWGTKQP